MARTKKDAKYKDILYEVVDQVAWITINRPHVLNACRELTLDEITEAVRNTRDDPMIACVVITGTGDRAFCSGGDFASMMRLNWVNGAHWNERMLGCATAIRSASIPVIAMVNGWCMGGGNELALWCDIVVASENAIFGQTGAKNGKRLAAAAGGIDDLPEHLRKSYNSESDNVPQTSRQLKLVKQRILDESVGMIERDFVVSALRKANGNVSEAARITQMHRKQFQRLMQRCSLTVQDIIS